MLETISAFFLETVGREWCVFFCALLPVIELRGAIPLAAGLGLSPLVAFAISVIGNMLPVPFLLLFLRFILRIMKKWRPFARFAAWLERRAEKSRQKIERYAFWGLFLFVAIPLPGTGAWTGSLVAVLTGMKFSRAFVSILGGVLTAGIIMTLLSYGTAAVIHLI